MSQSLSESENSNEGNRAKIERTRVALLAWGEGRLPHVRVYVNSVASCLGHLSADPESPQWLEQTMRCVRALEASMQPRPPLRLAPQ